MKEFKSKIGYEILIPVLIILIGVMFMPIFNGAPISTTVSIAAIILPTMAFIIHMFYGTTYRINDVSPRPRVPKI